MMPRILPLLLLPVSTCALAGNAVGHVTTITVANDNYAVVFQLDRPIEHTPQCNQYRRFAIHLKKPAGMAAYMALLEAKQQGYTVEVEGMNNCSNDWKSEDVKTITLN